VASSIRPLSSPRHQSIPLFPSTKSPWRKWECWRLVISSDGHRLIKTDWSLKLLHLKACLLSINIPHTRPAQVKVGLINLCKGLFSLNARIYIINWRVVHRQYLCNCLLSTYNLANRKVLPLGITALQPQSHFHLGTPYTTIPKHLQNKKCR
jgi:hypothetical protein